MSTPRQAARANYHVDLPKAVRISHPVEHIRGWVINPAIFDDPSTDIISTRQSLPVKYSSFDGVTPMAVPEHVDDPFACASCLKWPKSSTTAARRGQSPDHHPAQADQYLRQWPDLRQWPAGTN